MVLARAGGGNTAKGGAVLAIAHSSTLSLIVILINPRGSLTARRSARVGAALPEISPGAVTLCCCCAGTVLLKPMGLHPC